VGYACICALIKQTPLIVGSATRALRRILGWAKPGCFNTAATGIGSGGNTNSYKARASSGR
jgi:hypothetical protein